MTEPGLQMTLADESEEYRAFVEKFKPKKTTDDCYTPPEIYEAILGYVAGRYGIDPRNVVRPFWPGMDYERASYPDGCTVVDNPPFSILSKVISHYLGRGVGFFLFAPSLTCLSSRSHVMDINHIVCDANITYANGACVRTAFVTNLDTDGTVLESCPELGDLINAKDEELRKASKATLPKYEYPDHVITAAKAGWFAAHHTPFNVNRRDCIPIAALDAMGEKGIFGGGLLLSERAAAERAAAHKWKLSERELALVAMLGKENA
jgi:hypothetical protein